MTIWIRLLAIAGGLYNFAIGGRAILALPQVAVFALGIDDLGLPLPTSHFIAGLGGLFFIVHSVRLTMGFGSARRLQVWICGAAVVCRLASLPIQIHRFPDTSPWLAKVAVLIVVGIAFFDIPFFLAFRTGRVRKAYGLCDDDRRRREEDRDMQKAARF